MNEIAASLILIYFKEALYIRKYPNPNDVSNDIFQLASFIIDLEHAEADVFTLFNNIMEYG